MLKIFSKNYQQEAGLGPAHGILPTTFKNFKRTCDQIQNKDIP
jgi:hypothetical protein